MHDCHCVVYLVIVDPARALLDTRGVVCLVVIVGARDTLHLTSNGSLYCTGFWLSRVASLPFDAPATWLLKAVDHCNLKGITPREKITRTLCVAEDPDSVDGGAGGPALLVACADGSVLAWGSEGVGQGEQVYAEMRSLTHREIYTPLQLLFVTTAQVLSFSSPTLLSGLTWCTHL